MCWWLVSLPEWIFTRWWQMCARGRWRSYSSTAKRGKRGATFHRNASSCEVEGRKWWHRWGYRARYFPFSNIIPKLSPQILQNHLIQTFLIVALNCDRVVVPGSVGHHCAKHPRVPASNRPLRQPVAVPVVEFVHPEMRQLRIQPQAKCSFAMAWLQTALQKAIAS